MLKDDQRGKKVNKDTMEKFTSTERITEEKRQEDAETLTLRRFD